MKQLKEQAEARQGILLNQAIGMCIYILIILCICTNLTQYHKRKVLSAEDKINLLR